MRRITDRQLALLPRVQVHEVARVRLALSPLHDHALCAAWLHILQSPWSCNGLAQQEPDWWSEGVLLWGRGLSVWLARGVLHGAQVRCAAGLFAPEHASRVSGVWRGRYGRKQARRDSFGCLGSTGLPR